MSTSACIAIKTGTEEYTFVRVNFDGYESHMLPTLAYLTAEHGIEALQRLILEAVEIRGISTEDGIESYDRPLKPKVATSLEAGAEMGPYTYFHNGTEWVLY